MKEKRDQESLLRLFLMCRYATYSQTVGDVSYAYAIRNGELAILFDQSVGRQDWLNNLDFPAVAYRKSEDVWFCHRGFLKAWQIAEGHLKDPIRDPAVHRVAIVGYSHGGALAMLCHEYVWFHRPDLRDSLTGYGFGAPRVYWGLFMPSSLRDRWQAFTVVRNLEDIVTHLPPRMLGYRHVGRMQIIGKRRTYNGVDAHRPENYMRELREGSRPDFSHGFRQ